MAGKLQTMTSAAIGAAAGYAVARYTDPQMGRTRRARLADQMAARARRGADDLRRSAVQVADRAQGRVTEAMHDLMPDVAPNDPTLTQKVSSEVLGDPRFPSGRINVSAQDGTVVLRGNLASPALVRELEDCVRRIDGVHEVRNLVAIA